MSARSLTRLMLAVAVTAALGGTLVVAAGVLAALPSLLAFLPLLAGRYLGADRLERLIERTARTWERARSSPRPRPARVFGFARRGGLLIASSLAERPPPAPARS